MVFTVNVWITWCLNGYISQLPVSVILNTLLKKKKKEKNFSTCILLISAVFERVISTKPVTIGVFPVNLNIPESSVSHFFFSD